MVSNYSTRSYRNGTLGQKWPPIATAPPTTVVSELFRWKLCRRTNRRHTPVHRTTELLITADGGGSNGYRVRLWKVALQKFANETGLRISVCHFPPGTSKWNKIEHRMFSFISTNWRGRPLISHEVIVDLIGSTTTKKELSISAELDTNIYQKGIHVSDEELEAANLSKAQFHGEWNYAIASNCSG